MFWPVIRFELGYQLRRPSTWLYFAILFLLAFTFITSSVVEIGGGVGRVNKNAPFTIAQTMLILTAIGQIITGQQLAAERKKIAIHVTLPPSVTVMADSHAMMQVIENFLSNAVKYSPEGRNVYLKVFAQQDQVTLEVQDEGPGLSSEDQDKLFQKYSRLTPQPTGGESSNGLGLSIVKRLADSMGAKVGCRSTLGHGTVFWITLRGYCNVAAA